MGRTKRLISKDECKAINTLREENQGKVMSKQEILPMLKQILPTWYTGLIEIAVLPLLRIDKNVYKFPKEPIYIGAIQKLIDKRAETRKKSFDKCKEKEFSQSSEEIAIELLKGMGYKISKPFFDLEAAMANPKASVESFISYKTI